MYFAPLVVSIWPRTDTCMRGTDTKDLMCASQSSQQKIRVVLAENNLIHAGLLANAIARDRCLEVVYSTCTSLALLSQVPLLQPDVLVLSASLDEQPEGGIEILRTLRNIDSGVKVVILLDRSVADQVVKAFRFGARAIFCRNSPVKQLSRCIRVVNQGQIWASNEELKFVFQALAGSPFSHATNSPSISLLPNRERDVVRCLAEGMSNREIAERLRISPNTVKNYLFKIFDRLGVSSRVELLFYLMSTEGGSGIFSLLGSEGNGIHTRAHRL